MMSEEGTVRKISGEKATVLSRRSAMCESCGQKSACNTVTDNKDVEIEAVNTADAKVGDRVQVSIESSSLIKITTLVYLLPVIGLIIGIITGDKFAIKYSYDPELTSFLAGVFAFIFTFFIIKVIANRLGTQKKYQPEITKILRKSDDEEIEECTGPGAG